MCCVQVPVPCSECNHCVLQTWTNKVKQKPKSPHTRGCPFGIEGFTAQQLGKVRREAHEPDRKDKWEQIVKFCPTERYFQEQ